MWKRNGRKGGDKAVDALPFCVFLALLVQRSKVLALTWHQAKGSTRLGPRFKGTFWVLRNVMWKITDFQRRIVTSHNEAGFLTLSCVCPHWCLFPRLH